MSKTKYFNIGGVPEHFNIPFRKGIDEGIFSSKNIELQWKDYKGGTGDLVKALNEGQIDIGVLLTEGALKASLEKKSFKIIQIYVNTPLTWGVYAGAKSTWNKLSEISNPTFCISRPGSGSQLMAYLLCKREGWNTKDISFREVGNMSGALKEFNENPNHLFLWERFMTKPYVDSGTLKKLGEIPTPWPSFCIVANNTVIEENRDALIEILETIATYTYKFKQNTLESIDYISSYFDFSIPDMKEWIIGTDWNYYLDKPELKLDRVISFLKEMSLVDQDANEIDACPDAQFWKEVELYPPLP